MRRHLDHLIRTAIEWFFRRRSPALTLVRVGAGLLAVVLGGWTFSASIPWSAGPLSFTLDTAGATPAELAYAAASLGASLIVLGALWEFHRYRTEQRRIERKKVIVIEARGLRDTSGTPLINAVPTELEGHRDQLLLDVRQRVRDGTIIAPEAAVDRISALPGDLERREAGFDRRDVSLVYGGLMPVPLTFLTGVLMDDEGSVYIMDWDRHASAWRSLDAPDDGMRFTVSGIEEIQEGAQEVAVAISVSYAVDISACRLTFARIPLVRLDLNSSSPDCHWSEEKQQALARQFLETMIAIGNRGVRRIHILLAAQNSVVFRLARTYDKRNLPEAIVYQYERGSPFPYPWGVSMPVCGIARATVVRTDITDS